jgi:heme iron utilization protein
LSDARVTISGTVERVSEEEKTAARELYLRKNPSSFWVDFGDFSFFRMQSIARVWLIGGFAPVGSVR